MYIYIYTHTPPPWEWFIPWDLVPRHHAGAGHHSTGRDQLQGLHLRSSWEKLGKCRGKLGESRFISGDVGEISYKFLDIYGNIWKYSLYPPGMNFRHQK